MPRNWTQIQREKWLSRCGGFLKVAIADGLVLRDEKGSGIVPLYGHVQRRLAERGSSIRR
jgi:hypothetical protein